MFRILGIVLAALAVAVVAVGLPALLLSRRALSLEEIAAVGILGLLGWSLIELAMKAWRVRTEHRTVARFQDLFAKAQTAEHKPVPYSLRDPRAVRRINHMVECSKPDMSKLHEAVPAAASLDAAILAGSYGPLNVYAWALPVLGFMGTALGMAEAIRGFKDALGNTRGDLNVLVDTLASKVIPGLAGAFHVTILALGASLVVYLCTSVLRDWDQEALNKLDRLCIVMLSRIPLPEGPEGARIVAALDGLSQQLTAALKTSAEVETAAKVLTIAALQLREAGRELKESATATYSVTSIIERGRPSATRGPPPLTDGDARTP